MRNTKTTKHQDDKPRSLCTDCSESESKTQNHAVRMCCIHVLHHLTDAACAEAKPKQEPQLPPQGCGFSHTRIGQSRTHAL